MGCGSKQSNGSFWPTNSVTSSLSDSVTDVHGYMADLAVVVQPKIYISVAYSFPLSIPCLILNLNPSFSFKFAWFRRLAKCPHSPHLFIIVRAFGLHYDKTHTHTQSSQSRRQILSHSCLGNQLISTGAEKLPASLQTLSLSLSRSLSNTHTHTHTHTLTHTYTS